MAKATLTEGANNQSEATAHSATGPAAMDFAKEPAIVVNPSASARDLAIWACAELEGLQTWLHLIECSELEIHFSADEFGKLVGARLAPIVMVLAEAKGRA